MSQVDVTVIGAGLAGTECAFQLAEQGLHVRLMEQKPVQRSAAHFTDSFAELVCSNSLRAAAITNAVGLIKEEMRRASSLVMHAADASRVPAGGALAVDRELFAAAITSRLQAHRNIEIVAAQVGELPTERPVVIATGPMTAEPLVEAIASVIGSEHLAYYDAIAPIITADSIDWSQVFKASRYDKGGDDAYVNCPFDLEQYNAFVQAVLTAERMAVHAFEDVRYFEGCLPIEAMAERGPRTLAFGPMKPVGLTDPRTGRWPKAVVQLRQENAAASAYNMVGFQTRMTQPEQRRVFAMIPGLANARFERYGSVHRNTFVDAPRVLDERMMLSAAPGIYLAGQITGVEGYVESAACGLVVGRMLGATLQGRTLERPPPTTALGALLGHLRRPDAKFQPSNVVWSMFPELPTPVRDKQARREQMVARALADLDVWLGRSPT